jgi:phage baseplate assembly protein V
LSHILAEIDRRLANLIRLGTIAQLDEAKALVTVQVGTMETDWLPWRVSRAGGNVAWHAPEVGEQVILLAPSGDLGQAVVLGSLYQTAHPANANTKDVQRMTYQDGTVVEYDRAEHQLKVDASAASGTVLVNVGGGHVIVQCATAAVTATDSVTVDCATAAVTASQTVDVQAGASATVKAPAITLESPATTCTGALIVEGLLSFNAGMSGKPGPGGGAAAQIQGGMAITDGNVTADGIGLKTHTHREQGDGNNVGAPQG